MRINAINTVRQNKTVNRKQISFKNNGKEMPMTAQNKGVTQFERNIASQVTGKNIKNSSPVKTFFGKVNRFLNKTFKPSEDLSGISFEELAFMSLSRL